MVNKNQTRNKGKQFSKYDNQSNNEGEKGQIY